LSRAQTIKGCRRADGDARAPAEKGGLRGDDSGLCGQSDRVLLAGRCASITARGGRRRLRASRTCQSWGGGPGTTSRIARLGLPVPWGGRGNMRRGLHAAGNLIPRFER